MTILSIVPAAAIKHLSDRPAGSVQFFIGNQAETQSLSKLGSYVTTPKRVRLLWAFVALEERAKRARAMPSSTLPIFFQKNDISSALAR